MTTMWTILVHSGHVPSWPNPGIYNLTVLQPPIMCLSLPALTQSWNPWVNLGWFAVVACFWALISVAVSPLLQWATATRTWWRLELSKCNSSTPTHVSCTTTWSCTPRGCRPPYLTSCLSATLSTQGASSAHSSKTHRRHVRGAAQALISSLRYLMRRQIYTGECAVDPVRLLIDTWCWSLNWGYLPSITIQIMIPTNKESGWGFINHRAVTLEAMLSKVASGWMYETNRQRFTIHWAWCVSGVCWQVKVHTEDI